MFSFLCIFFVVYLKDQGRHWATSYLRFANVYNSQGWLGRNQRPGTPSGSLLGCQELNDHEPSSSAFQDTQCYKECIRSTVGSTWTWHFDVVCVCPKWETKPLHQKPTINNYSLKRNKYNLMRKDDLFNQRFWKKMTIHMQKKKNQHVYWLTVSTDMKSESHN